MGAGTTLTNHIKEFAILTIVVVVMSIVLIKFKDVDGVSSSLNTTIDSAVSAIDEPITWIAIVIIIVVVAFLLKYLKGGKGGSGL